MGKDYLGIQRLKKDSLNWPQYWTQLSIYLYSKGLLYIIQKNMGLLLHLKLQKEVPIISIN